jgi:hypothetical protein
LARVQLVDEEVDNDRKRQLDSPGSRSITIIRCTKEELLFKKLREQFFVTEAGGSKILFLSAGSRIVFSRIILLQQTALLRSEIKFLAHQKVHIIPLQRTF